MARVTTLSLLFAMLILTLVTSSYASPHGRVHTHRRRGTAARRCKVRPSSSVAAVVSSSSPHIISVTAPAAPPPSPTPEKAIPPSNAATETHTQVAAPAPPPPAKPSPQPQKSTPAPASPPPPPAQQPSSNGQTSQSDIDQYLTAHNTIRAQHGAAPLTWSDELASKAQQWSNGCIFKHSGGTLGPFGGETSFHALLALTSSDKQTLSENLAAGTGSSYDIAAAVKSWTDEVCE